MKNYSRIISLILSLMMILSLMTTAVAADGDYSDTDNPDTIWEFTGDIPGDFSDVDVDVTEFVPEDDLALTTSFKDVKTTAWYYNDVTDCAKRGIVQGFSDGTFKPEDTVTDVQFLTMITNAFYSDTVKKYNPVPAGQKWYYPYVQTSKDNNLLKGGKSGDPALSITEKNLNRYDMALVLYNVMVNKNKLTNVSATDLIMSYGSIKDKASVPANRVTAVQYCYALGIITGMSDGTFSGSKNMTRAQACTVIVRMMKHLGVYDAGNKDNNQYDDGKSQNTSAGKLANGKDITVANVQAMLEDIKRQYPAGTVWGDRNTPSNVNHWYNSSYNTVARKLITGIQSNLDTQYACGGWKMADPNCWS